MARNAKNTRMCAGCMERHDKNEFVCINKSSVGTVTIGCEKKSGRSVYLCKKTACMEKAIKKKWFSRSLKCEIEPDFYDKLREYFINN